MIHKLSVCFLFLLSSFYLPARVADSDDIVKQTFIYSIKGNDTLRLDKYSLPQTTTEARPCVIFVFGGGFAAGSRDHSTYLSFYEQLVHKGYSVVAIDYRLGMKNFKKTLDLSQSKVKLFNQFVSTFEKTLAMAVEDFFDATGYVVEHAEEWHIRTDRIISCGSSAGAITVLQGEYERCNHGKLSERLPQGFSYAGVISFAGAIFSEKGDLKWAGQPAPIQLFHGDIDDEVPYGKLKFRKLGFFGSQYIAAQLEKAGSPHYFYSVENASHEISSVPMKQNWDEINTFLEKLVLKKEEWVIHSSVKPTVKPAVRKKLKLSDFMSKYM
jgi:predicted esterase